MGFNSGFKGLTLPHNNCCTVNTHPVSVQTVTEPNNIPKFKTTLNTKMRHSKSRAGPTRTDLVSNHLSTKY